MLGWFAETTMVAMALAAVAALAGRVRPIGPTARHILWLAVLVKLMTPPLVSWPWAVNWRERDWPLLSHWAERADASPAIEVVRDDRALEMPISRAPAAAIEEAVDDAVPPHPAPAKAAPSVWIGIERSLIAGWLLVSGLLVAGQAGRILRFRRRLRLAVPAPDDLVDEAEQIARQLGSRVPELLVVPELGTPMLWCLGRPKLLLPALMVKTIPHDRWRGVLAHELAHLRRGDHWVSRLELIAGLFWWWNPLYWLTRARLDAEAELACDAWVVWALPTDRLAYAETLFDIGSALSRAVSPAPALGAVGSVRFLERRLTMILHERVSCRVSPFVLLAVVLMVLLALPSWSAATTPAADPSPPTTPGVATAASLSTVATVADDDDDDDDADRAKSKAKVKQKAEAKAKKSAPRPKAKARAEGKKGESEISETFGPEFQKKMEALDKEIEAKFGPGSDFEKQMKKLGEEMEAKFGPGSDFEKQMRKLGEEMEAKFGPEFQKKMEAVGKEMETKFGPGSDFEKQMKAMGEKMKQKAEAAARKGAEAQEDLERAEDRLEWAKRMKEKGYVSKRQLEAKEASLKRAKEAMAKAGEAKEKPKAKATAKARKREARIAAIEAQIRKLSQEIKELEEEDEDQR